ncbi:hypothetical protein ACFOKI_08085 [Sphingomonas qilianensis]|uniref:DUF423 domain-containing protein n=1 Tax=Sphingomonas qilianensis TaxID=1736690 RepID=A0ABU9XTT8_9SPHN
MRRMLGIVLGAALALAILAGIERMAHGLYPAAFDAAALSRSMAAVPLAAQLIIACAWLAAGFGGPWLALRVSDWRWAGWIIALLLITGNVLTLTALAHPLWLQAAAIALPLAGAGLAWRAHHKPYKGEPLLG